MPIIHYRAPIKLLVAVRGHPFDRSAFDAMFLAMDGITATMVDQPAARTRCTFTWGMTKNGPTRAVVNQRWIDFSRSSTTHAT